jgi:hypothetical protein
MTRLASTFLVAALTAAALPAAAGAGVGALRGAKVHKAVGQLTISETRCPPTAQSQSDCGIVRLKEDFGSGATPRSSTVPGRKGFPLGTRISGRGTGVCTAESPPEVVTGPDGSAQFLGSASRLTPGRFRASKVVAGNVRRGIRIAWLEPLAPGIACTYFGERSTKLALPAAGAIPPALVSPVLRARVVRRSRFSVLIAGSQEWTDQEQDGTRVAGKASWRLRLDYTR